MQKHHYSQQVDSIFTCYASYKSYINTCHCKNASRFNNQLLNNDKHLIQALSYLLKIIITLFIIHLNFVILIFMYLSIIMILRYINYFLNVLKLQIVVKHFLTVQRFTMLEEVHTLIVCLL